MQNCKSSPNVNKEINRPTKDILVSKLEVTKNNFLNSILRKLDTKLGHRAVKTVSRVAKKTADVDGDKPLLTRIENNHVEQETAYREADNPGGSVCSSLVLRKHTDVTEPPAEIHAKLPPKEVRAKSKFSPPPEAVDPLVSTTVVPFVSTVVRKEDMFRGGRKLKERFVVGVAVALVLFTLLLVVDIQMDLGMSGKHLVPSHGRVKYVVQDEGPGSAYNRFRNRLLQKTHRWVASGLIVLIFVFPCWIL